MTAEFDHPVETPDSLITKQPQATHAPNISRSFAQTFNVPEPNTYQNVITSMGGWFGSCGVFCCLCSNPYKEVQQGEVGLVTTFGALSRILDPGLSYVNTWSEKLHVVGVKINIREVPAQTCFTKDNVSVTITSVVYYNIIDPSKAVYSISNIHEAIAERTQTTLRDVIGGRVLQDVLEKREEIAESIENVIAKTAFLWGVHIESILIKDLQLPTSVQSSLSKAAESRRIGEAKIINARAEVESARQMRKASDILSSPAALQIRYLDALQNMSKNAGTRVIFMPSSDALERIVNANVNPNAVEANRTDLSLQPILEEQHTSSSLFDDTSRIAENVAMQEALRD